MNEHGRSNARWYDFIIRACIMWRNNDDVQEQELFIWTIVSRKRLSMKARTAVQNRRLARSYGVWRHNKTEIKFNFRQY